VKGWGESVSTIYVRKILGTVYSTFLLWCCLLLYMLYFKLSCVYCCSCLVCIVVVLCVLLSCVFVVFCALLFFTLDAGLLARSQYSEGPTTGYLDTSFSWFPCDYKQMLRWFPIFKVATICFSCSPPDLNLLVTNFLFCIHGK